MKIKIINPNTTQSMTDKIAALAKIVASSGTQIIAVSPQMYLQRLKVIMMKP